MRLRVGTQVYQIQWNNAMQRPLRHSRSFKVTDYGTNRKLIYNFLLVVIQTYLLSYTVYKLWLIICEIFASERECLTLTLSLGVIPFQYRHKWYIAKNRFFGHFFTNKQWAMTAHLCAHSDVCSPPPKLGGGTAEKWGAQKKNFLALHAGICAFPPLSICFQRLCIQTRFTCWRIHTLWVLLCSIQLSINIQLDVDVVETRHVMWQHVLNCWSTRWCCVCAGCSSRTGEFTRRQWTGLASRQVDVERTTAD